MMFNLNFYSTLVELKYLLYVCRAQLQIVEYEAIKDRRTAHGAYMEAR